ncbi:MAG: 16S rRNA (guanine(966)-N(2))-methyltransferase RsmD [Coriobacteriales bacterium]|jgi:16S rRNA (guanine966-N2)-methyltransferase|nr:16S rRNA (guanine(966)-N(2))-methyltransferase RsmD [Coriobacteriales bacterium]
MRIIAGTFKGRVLETVPGNKTRPTTDRVKEAWASSLWSLCASGLTGTKVLDAFAGSGALGLELLSRGAAQCVFCERDAQVQAVLSHNISALGMDEPQAQVLRVDSLSPQLLSGLKGIVPFDIVVLDPPYDLGLERIKGLMATLGRSGFVRSQTLVSLEHRARQTEDMDGFVLARACTPLALRLVLRKTYGTIGIDYYQCR